MSAAKEHWLDYEIGEAAARMDLDALAHLIDFRTAMLDAASSQEEYAWQYARYRDWLLNWRGSP